MKKIGVTGSKGFLGWHLIAYFFPMDDIEVIECSRECFEDSDKLKKFVSQCDSVVHLAGLNRGDEKDIYEVNIALMKKLIDACRETSSTPQIIFSSSTHIDKDTAYGKAKRESGEILLGWGKETGASVSNIVFPHIFGEYAKPFYNSAVATFCYQLANNESSEVSDKGSVSLLYAQEAAQIIYRLIQEPKTGNILTEGKDMTIKELYILLERFLLRLNLR